MSNSSVFLSKRMTESYGDTDMDDLLTPVSTVKKVQNNIEKFESLSTKENRPLSKGNQSLKSIASAKSSSVLEIDVSSDLRSRKNILEATTSSRTTTSNSENGTDIKLHRHHDSSAFRQQSYLKQPASPALSDNAREILRCQPSHEDLVAVLQYLEFGIEGQHEFNIHIASPKTAQIINVLISITIPDIWPSISQEELSANEVNIKKSIIACLRSVAGLGALLAQISHLTTSPSTEGLLSDTVSVLDHVLKGSKTLLHFLQHFPRLYTRESDRRSAWQEITALLAGSRVLSTTAKAFVTRPGLRNSSQPNLWLGSGDHYVEWLAGNIAHAAINLNLNTQESWVCLGHMVKRGLSLGHRDVFVAGIYSKLLLGQSALWTPLHNILNHLGSYEQRTLFDSVLSDLVRKFFTSESGIDTAYLSEPKTQKTIGGAAALIAGIIKNNEMLADHVEKWLTGEIGSSVMTSLSARRALIAACGQSEEKLQRILEKSLSNFGDKLQVQHASTVEQEAMAQTILLAIGHLIRVNIKIVKHLSISTLVMQATSNRLNASVPRSRFLGMLVGTVFSQLVDKPENVIDFNFNEAEKVTMDAWLKLINLTDQVGEVADLQSPFSITSQSGLVKRYKPPSKPSGTVAMSQTSRIIAIEELSDSSEDDEDLVPYQQPDSDPDDSEEDVTLINRSKPSAPVYIIDLIKQLQLTDKSDVISLALKTAPSLIRRKAAFGTEVSDNIQTLVTILVNLQEGMSDEHLQDLRLESLIACIIARPALIGPSLADVYFRGDFSLSQRNVLLVGVGLAVRELAGYPTDQSTPPTDNFPSKRLPSHLEPLPQPQISATLNPIAMLTDTAAQAMIRPMALAAADQATGPSALKIRTFSSRMEVEKRNQAKAAARTNVIPKNLHKLLTESIYLPLCSRMSLLLSHTVGGRLPNTTILHTSTLRLFLQTLTLVLHTLGPSASVHLPILTHESLLLLLNLHTISSMSTDPAVLPAVLHLLLALLDITIEAGVTAQERLITDHGSQVAELINWSNSLGDRISVPSSEGVEGGIAWSVLAAGIQVKWFEMGRRFQGKMLGLSVDEMDQLARA